MKLKPTDDNVILKRINDPSVTRGGILIPGNAKEPATKAKVVAVGPGRFHPEINKRRPIELKVGQKVIFTNYNGFDFEVLGKKYLVLPESEVTVIIEN